MKKVFINIFLISILCGFFAISCNEPSKQNEEPVAATVPDLNSVKTNLPDSPGHRAFVMNCVVCHSQRMVENQPDLSEKAWSGIVTKMQKTFGAPVSDSAASEIVRYLVSIKGAE